MILAANISAQTFIVDNLPQAIGDGGVDTSLEDWRAVSFTTDSTGPYSLQSVTIAHNHFTTFPTDAFIALYGNSASNLPGTEIGQFADTFTTITNASFANYHTFPAAGNLNVASDTSYWLVFGSTSDAGFNLETTSSTDQNGMWTIGDNYYSSGYNFGTSTRLPWRQESDTIAFGLTIVPEPSEYVLASVLTIGIFIFIRRHKVNRSI